MNKLITFAIILILIFIISNNCHSQQIDSEITKSAIIGHWISQKNNTEVSLFFKENSIVECDFGNDQSIDVVAEYSLVNADIIEFYDIEGQACPLAGVYKIYRNDYYLSFDLIKDECGGRIKSTMGFWVAPEYEEQLTDLNQKINASPDSELLLTRARMYMAIGKSESARKDLDKYLLTNSANARAYINRAGTRFPFDMEGVVKDCTKAITLDSENKNAYFLMGLALYNLGEEKQACECFSKAIDLGFTILEEAEAYRCDQFWKLIDVHY